MSIARTRFWVAKGAFLGHKLRPLSSVIEADDLALVTVYLSLLREVVVLGRRHALTKNELTGMIHLAPSTANCTGTSLSRILPPHAWFPRSKYKIMLYLALVPRPVQAASSR